MPELNDIGQWTMRRSEVADFKRCPHKWYLRYVMGLRAPPPPDRPVSLSGTEYDPEDNLWLGTQWHDVVEYGLGSVVGAGPLPTAEMIVRVHEAARARAAELRQEYPLLPIWFGDRTLTPWAAMLAGLDMVAEVVATEAQLSMPLAYLPGAARWPGLALVGTLDGIIADRWGNQWIMEHKTAGGSVRPDELAEAYRLDEQATCYTMLAQHCGYNVMGVFLDAVRKTTAEKPTAPVAGHTLITRPQTALNLYLTDLRWVVAGMAELAGGEDPEAAHRVANPIGGQGCYCPFVRLCEAKIQGEDWEDVMQGRYTCGT